MVNQVLTTPGAGTLPLPMSWDFFLEHQLHSNSFYCCDDEIAEENQATAPMECEANYFADCFLMPETKVKSAFLSMLANSHKAKIKDYRM